MIIVKGWIVHIEGRVQGVGFRPFISRFSKEREITGWIRNTNKGVQIFWATGEESLDSCIKAMRAHLPLAARIDAISAKYGEENARPGFHILPSLGSDEVAMDITPDLGLCPACQKDIFNAADRHYQYPFTSCTDCGPRYSVQRTTPYDRETTTMEPFSLCPLCENEYSDGSDRRFHAQSISCPEFGIPFYLKDSSGVIIHNDRDPGFWARVNELLKNGKILAVKGIGGYMLIVDARNVEAVRTLRERKHRPAKPFAVLYPDIDTASAELEITGSQKALLSSAEAPIVLCDIREHGDWLEEVAPELRQLGIMLPYAPVLALISKGFSGPLVATSGNVSGSPILYRDDEAVRQLSGIADAFLSHDREIVTPQDDSVVRMAGRDDQKIFLRRSRGYAPEVPGHLFHGWNENVLAMGSDLKSTLAWRRRDHTYVSQYMGNLGTFESQEYLKGLILHWEALLRDRPEQILVDAHPGYFSHHIGLDLANRWNLPVQKVFHHEAHAFALMAEHSQASVSENVHFLVWDGTGLGRDDAIWGGELFLYEEGVMNRVAHMEYQAQWVGDKMSLEPRIAAFSYTRMTPGIQEQLMGHFSLQEWEWYRKLNAMIPAQLTSSTGRLFDAAAVLSGWRGTRQYEGQAAMWLEAKATDFVKMNGFPEAPEWNWSGNRWDPAPILQQVYMDAQRGRTGLAAARFHASMIGLVEEMVTRFSMTTLGFSGGVFQNALLVEGIRERLGDRLPLWWHRDMSPNDECISTGQLASLYIPARFGKAGKKVITESLFT